jgi:Tol biopolymer transport system component
MRDTRPEPDQLPPGARLGPYQIEMLLGVGGMGEVYRATDERLGRRVAIKVLLPGAATDAERRRRFELEARVVSSLNHPHICALHDIGSEVPALPTGATPRRSEPVDFLVMEYLEGQTLRERLAKGPLPVAEALELAVEIADALAAAHRRGIFHRDLKPANVILTRSGAKLLDFGLAKVKAAEPVGRISTMSTRPGVILGTRPYMAPEQLEGKEVDARTDLFAFGCVLHEMLTGRRAFEGDSEASIISAIMVKEPASVRSLQPRVPLPLDRLVRACLAKDRDRRWHSAHDLAEQLRALAEAGDDAAMPGAASRSWWSARHAAAALALVGLGAAIGVPLARRIASPEPAVKVVPRNITTSLAWDGEPALSPDGTRVAFTSGESGNADIWVVPAQGGTTLRVTDDAAWDSSPAWFPDGAQLAFASDRLGSRGIWRVSPGGAATLLVPDAEDPALSPDGGRIAFVRVALTGYRRVLVAPIADVSAARALTGDRDGVFDHRGPAWSPDGRTLVYGAQRDLWLVSADGGKPTRLTIDGEIDVDPCWSSDGRHVLFASDREGTRALWRVPVRGGPPTRVTLGTGPEQHPSVSRDGRRLVYATTLVNLDLELRDLAAERVTRYGSARSDVHPALAPDGKMLYFISDRLGKYDLWAQPLSGIEPVGPAHRLTDEPGSVSMPSASPDGRFVAFGSAVQGRRQIWSIPALGGPKVALTDPSTFSGEPAWSPDGARLALVGGAHGLGHIWWIPVADGRPAGPAAQISSGPDVHEVPAWSPDGTEIAYVTMAGQRGDVWIASVDGARPPRRVTSGAEAAEVRWSAGGRLFVCGFWGSGSPSVRSMTPAGRDVVRVADPVGRSADSVLFDLSRDGRILVVTAEQRRGNISGLDADSRIY